MEDGSPGSAVPIRVEGLGKRYKLGEERSGYSLLSDQVGAMLSAPGRWLRRGSSAREPSAETFWAVRDVSFEVRQGETLGLIGRNGAGKSTLLKLLSRITLPTEGRITTYGRIATLLEVGTGFHPELTGRENVFLNGTILGMRRTEIAARFDEIVEFSGVERFLDTPVKRYSSGMYVRLAFAIAAHLDPEILMVDEVLSVGDTEFQQKCLGKIRDVANEGRTVVFVSHNLNAVQRLCSRVLLLEDGGVLMDGAPADVVTEYFHRIEPDQAGGVAIIPPEHPRAGAGGGRLVRATMTNAEGEQIRSLRLGQRFRVQATFEIERAMDAVVEVGLSTGEGERAVTVLSSDRGRPPFRFEPGVHEVASELELTMVPGEYVIDIALHAPGDAILHATPTADNVERVLRFTALSIGEDGDHWPGWRSPSGYVSPESAWSEVETEQQVPT